MFHFFVLHKVHHGLYREREIGNGTNNIINVKMVQRVKPVRSCWNACIVDKISNEFHMCMLYVWFVSLSFYLRLHNFVYAFLLVPVSVYRWTDFRNTHRHTIICTLNIGAIKFKNREVNSKNGPSSAADRLRQFNCTLDAIFERICSSFSYFYHFDVGTLFALLPVCQCVCKWFIYCWFIWCPLLLLLLISFLSHFSGGLCACVDFIYSSKEK